MYEVRSQEDYDRIDEFYQEMGAWFWLGGNDIETEGNCIWNSDEEAMNLVDFWSNGGPSNIATFSCLLIGSSGMYGYWCTTTWASICRYD